MSALFQPFRALGYITEKVPFAVQRRGKETFVTVGVGKAWQVYRCAKLTLALVGPELPSTIKALAARGDLTFAAVKGDIFECERVRRSGVYRGHSEDIIQLLVLGDLLLSLGADRKLVVWRIGTYHEPEAVIELGEDFEPSCMAHPETYLNKVVVGSTAGQLQLWNFVSGERLYSFSVAACAVRCIAPSPALDVVGIGLADGTALLHNLKYDEQIASFANASGVGAKAGLLLDPTASKSPGGSACTAIAFRTGAGVPLMAAGGGSGAITVWNLEQKRLHTLIRDAHDGPLLSLHFFAGEPRLMSSAADNSLKQWLFDSADGSGRLLRFRSGHSAPPAVLRHYGDGNRLLSAGTDRAFRVFSVIQDQQSRELSQGHVARRAKRLKVEQAELKLPRVTAMDACQVRERDWANVITGHADDPAAYTWRLQHFTLGDHVLRPQTKRERGKDPLPEAPVTAVAMSSCGNFGIVGTASGRVDRYNMQSGIHRGTYARAPLDGVHRNAHTGAVVGLAADSFNHTLVSAGFDGWLRCWEFKKCRMGLEIQVGSAISKLAAHPGTALIAVAADDLVLRMYDVETGRQVRSFAGHRDRITDVGISADGKWLLSSSLDGTLRVWDIPAARTLQVVRLGAPVTSLSLAPGQELLATTHANRKGIYLWANQYIFSGAADIVPSEVPVDARLPAIAAEEEGVENGRDGRLSDAESDEDSASLLEVYQCGAAEISSSDRVAAGQYHDRHASGAPAPLLPQMVTLSLLPRTQWQNLAHLDAIKERGRPIQPPKKPEAAPFFLPTVPSLSRRPVFDTAASSTPAPAAENRVLPGWGEGEEHGGLAEAEEEAGLDGKAAGSKRKSKSANLSSAAKRSKVLRNSVAANEPSEFIRALRAGAEAQDFSRAMQLLREMSPVAVDLELQAMQVVDLENAADSEEAADLDRLLQCIQAEIDTGRSFEYVQALLRAALRIHGEALGELDGLNQRVAALESSLAALWTRLQNKLQHVRCLVNFLGNLPS